VQVGPVPGVVGRRRRRPEWRCVRGERRHQLVLERHQVPRRDTWCEGIGFYTLGAFLEAAGAHPGFARDGSEADGKREIAAFFAHVTHETGCKLLQASCIITTKMQN
jgi:hypothetical protein